MSRTIQSMRKVFSKIIIWLISLNILLSTVPIAYAEKYSIDRCGRYLDSEVSFSLVMKIKFT